MTESYRRFQVERPQYLADSYWECIKVEADRLSRSLDAGDASQALSDLKCLVESVSKIVLDINGTPPGSNDNFQGLVKRAHDLLAKQPGYELVDTSPFGDMSTQSKKIACNLAEIRNNYGGGHGRFRVPDLADEMLHMALDGSLMWVRWALRRIGYFAEGRPDQLIDALIGERKIFHAGQLEIRLMAANLPGLEAKHQRSIGVAVGQRAERGTFVVRADGVDACVGSDDIGVWPQEYRFGVVWGLWVNEEGHVSISSQHIRDTMRLLDPVSDCSNDLTGLVNEIVAAKIALPGIDDGEDDEEVKRSVQDLMAVVQELDEWLRTRPDTEAADWKRLSAACNPAAE
ncbi:abortive infection family protein [Nocardia testacea]|uniref:abortive infection family protein n=1 Tax=Nocardia testacea TaxID=248551 RepID=UPI0005850149|nr:abortive infection family protein [Nocardia testacea]